MSFSDDDLARFHAGDKATLAACYEAHYDDVAAAVAGVLPEADRDTVVHEVFFALLTDEALRRNFQGGSLGAWLRTVAKNRAIDHRRRHQDRERPLSEPIENANAAADHRPAEAALQGQLDARRFLAQIQACMPDKWRGVFEARFVGGLSQREAARHLRMHRTTLAYQELQIRRLLRKWLKESRGS